MVINFIKNNNMEDDPGRNKENTTEMTRKCFNFQNIYAEKHFCSINLRVNPVPSREVFRDPKVFVHNL